MASLARLLAGIWSMPIKAVSPKQAFNGYLPPTSDAPDPGAS
jgi:hypothetical protein